MKEPLLRRRPPRQTQARCEVVPVSPICVRIGRQVLVLRCLPRQRAGFEQVAHTRHTPDVRDRRGRVAVVARNEGQLQFVPQTVVDGQILARTPGVLNEAPELVQPAALDARSEVFVLAGAFVQAGICVDRIHASGEHGVQSPCVGQVRAGCAREVRGVEHRIGRITCRDAKGNGRHHGLVVGPQADVCERDPEVETVRAFEPG